MQRLTQYYLRAGIGIALAAFTALQAGPGRAGEGSDMTVGGGEPAGSRDAATQTGIAAPGLRVYRDPRTGRLGPPQPGAAMPELTAAERRMLSRSDRGLRARTLPGRGVAVDLQGRYRNMAVATVGAGGQAEVNCAVTPARATAILQADQATAAGPAD